MSSDSDSEGKSKVKRGKKRQFIESDEEIDEQERRNELRRKNVSSFIFDEAAVDEDDEEEYDEEYDEDNFEDTLDNPDEVAEAEDTMNYVKFDNKNRTSLLDIENEEELEEHYRRKYEDDQEEEYGYGGEAMKVEITQQKCLPGVRDANLWQMPCFRGEERNTVLKLMHKYMLLRYKNGQEMSILSVFAKESTPGYIYIEALKENHVKIAAEGINAIAFGISKFKMVPINEMQDVLRVNKSFKKMEYGQFVRISKGIYKDDLAKIMEVDDAGSNVTLMIVPRIDYQFLVAPSRDKNKRFVRPQKMLFNRKRARELGLEVNKEDSNYICKRSEYTEKGFLLKKFKLNYISTEGVTPELQELELFQEKVESQQVTKQIKKGLEEATQAFKVGDNVVIIHGQLQNSGGVVVSVEGKTVILKHSDLKENMSFQSDELRKVFKVGNNVRIISGQNEGELGLVINVVGSTVYVLSNTNTTTFKVQSRNVELVSHTANTVSSFHQFSVNDLIEIDPRTVAVVIQFQKNNMKVLSNTNKVLTLDANSNFRKKTNNRSMTLDMNRNELKPKDNVDIAKGPLAGKQGEIKYIWKNFVFVHNHVFIENNGLIAINSSALQKKGTITNYSVVQNNSVAQSPRIHNTDENNNNIKSREFKKPFVQKNDRKFIGSTVRIIKGPLKGKVGIIKDMKVDVAIVELHSEYKTVPVSKENFMLYSSDGQLIDSSFGTPKDKFGATGSSSAWGGKTPNYGSQTPMYGSSTPFNSRGNDGSRTPMVGSSYTPKGNGHDTSRTGAFNPTAATPIHSFRNNDDIFAQQTPAYGDNSNNLSDDDEDFGAWNSGNKSNAPDSPDVYQPTPSFEAYTPLTSITSDAEESSFTRRNGDAIRADHLVRNVEVKVLGFGSQAKVGIIQGERGGSVTVRLPDENRIVNVDRMNVLRKEPESGNRILYMHPEEGKIIGTCLSIDNGDAVTSFDKGVLKLLKLQDIVPYNDEGKDAS